MARKRLMDHNSLYEGRWIVGDNDPDGSDEDEFQTSDSKGQRETSSETHETSRRRSYLQVRQLQPH